MVPMDPCFKFGNGNVGRRCNPSSGISEPILETRHKRPLPSGYHGDTWQVSGLAAGEKVVMSAFGTAFDALEHESQSARCQIQI